MSCVSAGYQDKKNSSALRGIETILLCSMLIVCGLVNQTCSRCNLMMINQHSTGGFLFIVFIFLKVESLGCSVVGRPKKSIVGIAVGFLNFWRNLHILQSKQCIVYWLDKSNWSNSWSDDCGLYFHSGWFFNHMSIASLLMWNESRLCSVI